LKLSTSMKHVIVLIKFFPMLQMTMPPAIEKRMKGRGNPWTSEDLLMAIRERDYLLKNASTSKLEADWKAYKYSRNRTNKIKTNTKAEYYKNPLRDLKDKPKEL